jgi:hypothetical protein
LQFLDQYRNPETLPDVERPDWTFRPWLPVHNKVGDVDACTRHESKRGVEGVADPLVLQRHVPEVIRIIDLESRRAPVAVPEIVSPRVESPHAYQKILVTAKTRRLVGEIRPDQPATRPAKRIPRRGDKAD